MFRKLKEKQMYGVIAVCVLLVISVAAFRLYKQHTAGPDVSRQQFQDWVNHGDDMLILDVRSPKEYGSGHVPGAINISHKQIPAHLDELQQYKNRRIVVYCESGVRSRIAQTTLDKAGFSEVYHLTGDMAGWRAAGLPMETEKGQ